MRTNAGIPMTISMTIRKAFEGKLNQAIHQLAERDATCLPKHGIHADRCESGKRVDFIDKHPVGVSLHKEVNPRQSGKVKRLEGIDRQTLEISQQLRIDSRRNDQLGRVFNDLAL